MAAPAWSSARCSSAGCGLRYPTSEEITTRSKNRRSLHRLSLACCTAAIPSVTRTSVASRRSDRKADLASGNMVTQRPSSASNLATTADSDAAVFTCLSSRANRSTRRSSRSSSARRYAAHSSSLQAWNAVANSRKVECPLKNSACSAASAAASVRA